MERKRKWMIFLGGFAAAVVIGIVAPLVVLASGAINMSAAQGPGAIESAVAPWAFDRSMSMRAPDQADPFLGDRAAIDAGLDHYRENCIVCHGAPGVEPGKLAKGLNPPAPKLYSQDSQEMSDGELFWIVKNGVRMSGMPAFGKTRTDDQIWKIVAFLRHLPEVSPSERESLADANAKPKQINQSEPEPAGAAAN